MVENKLSIDGYYYYDRPFSSGMFALYPDGTYLHFFLDKGMGKYAGKTVSNLDSIIWLPKSRKLEHIGGIYKLVDDTLIIYIFKLENVLKLREAWYYEIEKYEILDKNTLRYFEGISMSKHVKVYDCNQIYRFVKASPLPSPYEAEVKTKKWIWQNKKDWKAYMIEVNKYLDRKVAKDTVR